MAQNKSGNSSAEIYQELNKLKTLGSVLYVAAHPDDENTALITFLSKDRLYRTGYLSLTRGDGGQNLIGDEQGIELGLIRTQELLAARAIDGGEQFFSRAFDFGYSKNPEETFEKWDKNKILSDVVWVIRKFQPDIIITRFPTTGEGGHGHHTASAILANEAFTAAANPAVFPEQLQWVKPWQAKRIMLNGFRFGNVNTTDNSQLQLDIGAYNPLLGNSYGEIAAASRSQHKSQGFGATPRRGELIEYFKITGGDVTGTDIMSGVNTSWQRIPKGDAVAAAIDKIIKEFNFLKPASSIPELVQLYRMIQQLPDGYWKQIKLEETSRLILQCCGLYTDALSDKAVAVNGGALSVNVQLNNRLGDNIVLQKVSLIGQVRSDTSCNIVLGKNKNITVNRTVTLPENGVTSQPYWLQNTKAEGYYVVNDPTVIGQPDAGTPYHVQLQLKIDGVEFTFSQPVKFKFTDPVQGELYQPLVIVPPLLVTPVAPLKIVKPGEDISGSILVKSYNKQQPYNITESIFPKNASNLKLQQNKGVVSNIDNAAEVRYGFTYPEGGDINVKVFGDNAVPEKGYSQDIVRINHQHIPAIHYFTDSKIQVRNIDVQHVNKTVGYIIGAGDKVPEALEKMGYQVTLLTEKEMAKVNLKQFDAIIAGVRAYNTNEWLSSYYTKLMEYVADGGNLIVQYNTSSNAGPLRIKIGPYDFNVSRTRVTDENAKVNFLLPEHRVLNTPNKITSKDFEGWIQERSIYHAAGYDKTKYQAPLSMGDKNENEDSGSLIIAPYGKGFFTYTGIVFFRELPAGVPGAYRLLANIIDLNAKKGF